ncbi:lysylphosphatidylglycerol synthase domain-containing protein [Paraburkholderia sp. MMS20-SJTN17]|uniref:Lysylphosphatidylglycerol synthase domain-containing protein n=1 Tax=Paraburkholderia translucens TaxID=2886945 RepID=A0ABS8KJ76_9BURK|nr:lysylphosphatidylglycerol synthase domain-containing protein [Paraburkholderia sp. MMS20-SJTN17]MCC8404827.1 lysylphosphatidylglycerol synthase domain-containing protein [Paraburkholderia sp. MMS20-SJTN17]
MMKHLGRAAALAGLLVSLWLVWREDPRAVLSALRAAGGGLVLAAFAHVLPMIANACDWRSLIRGANRPSFGKMLHLVWVRESVNCMLPVARIGGELVSFRMLKRWGVRPSTAVGSTVVDMQLTVISQLMFTMVGIGFLFANAQSGALRLAGQLAWGVVALTPVLLLFGLVQHANPFERITRVLNHVTSGKLASLVGQSAQIDQSIKLIWRRRAVVLRYLFFWQPLQCVLTSLEIWLALYFLGARVTLVEAVVIESLIQAISSAAFFVPGGLGVQEGAFVLIGGALGLDPATSLALAAARRIRDLLMFVPGLIAWQFAEASGGAPAHVAPHGVRAELAEQRSSVADAERR